MEQIELHVTKRDVLGKKVRFLRHEGVTPVHLYGHNVDSLSLQCETALLKQALAKAGKTRIINLQIDKTKKTRTVMVRETQKNSISGELFHVDLYQVSATEKTKVQVPIILVGEAPALKSKDNLLEHDITAITVECLPTQIPDSITIDISSMIEDNAAIKVKDIKVAEGLTILVDMERPIVRIGKRYVEKEIPVAAAAEAVEGAEAAAAEGAAGEEKGKEAAAEKTGKEAPKAEKEAKGK